MSTTGPARGLLAAALAAIAISVGPARAAGRAVVLGRLAVRRPRDLASKAVRLVDDVAPGKGTELIRRLLDKLADKAHPDLRQLVGQELGALLDTTGADGVVDWSQPLALTVLSGRPFGRAKPVGVLVVALRKPDELKAAVARAAQAPVEARGNYAVIASHAGVLEAVSPRQTASYGAFPAFCAASDVYATVYVGRTLAELAPQIDEGVARLIPEADELADNPMLKMMGLGDLLRKAVRCIGPLARFAGAQVRRVSATAGVDDRSLSLGGRIYAARGTALSALFAGQPRDTPALATFLPPECIASVVGKSDMARFAPLATAIADTIAQALSLEDGERQGVHDFIVGAVEGRAAEGAVGFVPAADRKTLHTIAVERIADPAAFREAVQATFLATAAPPAPFPGFPAPKAHLDHQPGHRRHREVAIDRLAAVLLGPDGHPRPGATPLKTAELAVVESYGIVVEDDPTGALLDGVIGRMKGDPGGLAAAAAYRAATADVPEGACVVFVLDANRIAAQHRQQITDRLPRQIAMVAGVALGLTADGKPAPDEPPMTGHIQFLTYQRQGATMKLHLGLPRQFLLALARFVLAQASGPSPAAP